MHFILRDYGPYRGHQLFKSYENEQEITASKPTSLCHSTVTFSDRANATFVFLCRNDDLSGVVTSIQQMEDRFNGRYKYPWVLLNEEPFTENFKRCGCLYFHSFWTQYLCRRVSVLTDAPISFGQISSEHWYQPEWVDEDRARAGRLHMMSQGIIYAGRCLLIARYFQSFTPQIGSVPWVPFYWFCSIVNL